VALMGPDRFGGSIGGLTGVKHPPPLACYLAWNRSLPNSTAL
jgi:hypothetical protein